MKKALQEYFYFTKSERSGIKLLLSLLFLTFLGLLLAPQFYPAPEKVDFSALKTAFAKLEAEEATKKLNTATTENKTTNVAITYFPFDPNQASQAQLKKLGLSQKQINILQNYRKKGGKFFEKEDLQKIYGITPADYQRLEAYIDIPSTLRPKNTEIAESTTIPTEVKTVESFPFDPNTVTKADLQRLGLPDKTINIMLNYRAKGATFRKKEDFARIYGLSPTQFERLEPYLRFPKKSESSQKKPRQVLAAFENDRNDDRSSKVIAPIDINTANLADWESLRGIGPAYANRIIKFRDKLGGFHDRSQLKETYGLPDSTFQAILPYLINSPVPNKININTASLEALKAHPYIPWKKANGIVQYRQNHGKFDRIEDLQKIGSINPAFFEKIKPYLKVE